MAHLRRVQALTSRVTPAQFVCAFETIRVRIQTQLQVCRIPFVFFCLFFFCFVFFYFILYIFFFYFILYFLSCFYSSIDLFLMKPMNLMFLIYAITFILPRARLFKTYFFNQCFVKISMLISQIHQHFLLKKIEKLLQSTKISVYLIRKS